MHSYIRPGTEVVLRLPSGLLKIVRITPDTIISIPKIGTFSANLLLGRPYHFTYEVQDQQDGKKEAALRIVSAEELNLETVSDKSATAAESRDEKLLSDGFDSDNAGQNGERNNRLTVDDSSRQALTMEQIEELKRADPGSGKEIISQIMAAHSAINEKTSFSLAKYTLRKSRKYLKRFTVLPLDVSMLIEVILEKDAPKIMELREEMLGLIMSWSNVHHTGDMGPAVDEQQLIGRGRWLVVDDTGGLVVAAMAERMGLLYKYNEEDGEDDMDQESTKIHQTEAQRLSPEPEAMQIDDDPDTGLKISSKPPYIRKSLSKPQNVTYNTLTVIHANPQPNLSLLKYFSYSAEDPSSSQDHPLYSHLKTVTWLQLINPSTDALYQEPTPISQSALAEMKSGKRGNYYRKRNRWEKVKRVVDETRAGGFDGLVVASTMESTGIMKHCVPLVRGGGNIVVYSPSAEPLTLLMDYYSRDRKGDYVRINQAAVEEGKAPLIDEERDFPLNPTLLLNPMLQTARAREWQVLPGRTHPLMTSRGGSEGYLFTATRVLPKKGVKVEARGKFSKKRKTVESEQASAAEAAAGSGSGKKTKAEEVRDKESPLAADRIEES